MIYQRLTIRTCARYATIICPIITLISGLVFFSRLLGDTAAGEIPGFILGNLFVLTLLKYAPQILILSVFAGVFVTMRRAFTQNEMYAWYSSGLGLHSFIKPVLLFALPAAAFVALFSLYASPWAVNKMNTTRAAAVFSVDLESLPTKQFGSAPHGQYNYFLEDDDTLFIANNARGEVVFANGIARDGDTALQLINGSLFFISEQNGVRAMERMEFGTMRVALPAVAALRQRPRAKPLDALEWSDGKERGELLWRLMLPIATVALTLTALFLSPTHSRVRRRFGFLSAIVVFFAYLHLLRFMRDQVAHDALPAAVALLAPPLLLLLLSLALSWRRM